MFERYPEYAREIRRALRNAPNGELNSQELRTAAGFQVGVFLPVVTQMEREGTLVNRWDEGNPPCRLYRLPATKPT